VTTLQVGRVLMSVIFQADFASGYFDDWTYVHSDDVKRLDGIGCGGGPAALEVTTTNGISLAQGLCCNTVYTSLALRCQIAAFDADGDALWQRSGVDRFIGIAGYNATLGGFAGPADYFCPGDRPPLDSYIYIYSRSFGIELSLKRDGTLRLGEAQTTPSSADSAAGAFPVDGKFHGVQMLFSVSGNDLTASVVVDNVEVLTYSGSFVPNSDCPTWGQHFIGKDPPDFYTINGAFNVGVSGYLSATGYTPAYCVPATGGVLFGEVVVDDSATQVSYPACTGVGIGPYSFWKPPLVSGMRYDTATGRITITGSQFAYFVGDAEHSATATIQDPDGVEMVFDVVSQSGSSIVVGNLSPPVKQGTYCVTVHNPCRETEGHGEGGL
jgi:hypothetical protein